MEPTLNPEDGEARCDVHQGERFYEVRTLAASLPRATEAVVRDRLKFRIGRIVWLAFSRVESNMGFAFPKGERSALVDSAPGVFMLPRPSELRYNWVESNLELIEPSLARELVLDAWAMCVPKFVSTEYFERVDRQLSCRRVSATAPVPIRVEGQSNE